MFRLEKVFQNDDSGFILFINFVKSLLLIFSTYIFVVLRNNSIFDLLNFQIFKNSNYLFFSIFIFITFFILTFFLKNSENYQKNFISFIKEDLLYLLASYIFFVLLIFALNINFNFELNLIYILIFHTVLLFVFKLYFNSLYQKLIEKNIIQKNVMLIGSYEDVKKILQEKHDKIFIFKCCIITNIKKFNLKLIKSEIKFPVFKESDDLRSILEYHFLGQIWILNGDKYDKKKFSKIFKFSVDTLNIKLDAELNSKEKKLIAGKYDYEFFEKSRFYGVNLFLKIIIDKILSIIFLLIASPVLLISMLFIYFEDGFPLFFTQNRTGWDGRRFKIYKLRSLKKTFFDKTKQVTKNDKRILKIGKFIRRYSIDELPQFLNVLNGDMSIVGPRPHMVEHDIYYSNLFYNFLKRHKCNPGLTGWAQINGVRGATPTSDIMKKRMELDLWYLNNWTIYLDIYIIFKTFYALIKYKGE